MTLYDKWKESITTVYDSQELSTLELLEDITNFTDDIAKGVDDLDIKLKDKTDNNGDHKGTWQGLNRPTLSEEGMRATVEKINDVDIPLINASLVQIENNLDIIKVSNFGNDFSSFKSAINYCKNNNKILNIDIDLNLVNVTTISVDFKLDILSNNKKIKFDNTLFDVTNYLSIKGIVFDLDESGFFKVADVRTYAEFKCSDCKFINFTNKITAKPCVIINLENGSKSNLKNIKVENIKSIGNGVISDGVGSQRFIQTSNNQLGDTVSGYTIIENIEVNDFYNINTSSFPITEDSDFIAIQHGNTTKNHNTYIKDISCKNIGKRVIKSQSNNVYIDNIYVDNMSFTENLTVVGVMNADNFEVKNIHVDGDNQKTLFIEGFGVNNLSIKNVFLNTSFSNTLSGSAFNLQGKNISINDVFGKASGFIVIYGNSKNIYVEKVTLDVDYRGVFINQYTNDYDIDNIKFTNINLNSKITSNTSLLYIKEGVIKTGRIDFDTCYFNFLTSYLYGVCVLEKNTNTKFLNSYINTNNVGSGIGIKDCDVEFVNTTIDVSTISGTSNVYLNTSKVNTINSYSNTNSIYINSLLNTPTINHYSGSTVSTLKKYYNL